MSEFVQAPALDTKLFKLEIYKGSGEQLFLRISERSDKYDEWNEACLSAKEAEQLRAFLDTCLPGSGGGSRGV